MSAHPLTLVVLAAGIGSRYGGLKQMDPMGPHGEIIIDYSVYDALRAGFNKVVFVISAAIQDAFRERVGHTIERHVETAYVVQRLDDLPQGWTVPPERKKPWGTGHATLVVRDAVDGPCCVINADDFYGRTAYAAVAEYLARGSEVDRSPNDYCMVGYRLGNTLTEHGTVARGICTVNDEGYLVNVRERTRIERYGAAARDTGDGETPVDLSLDTIVSMNIWGFTPGVFAELSARFPRFLERSRANPERAEFFLPTVVGEMITDGAARVKVLATDEMWHGVTYAQDKPRVHAAVNKLVQQGIYPEHLWG